MDANALIIGAPGIEGKPVVLPSHAAINALSEKHQHAVHEGDLDKKGSLDPEITAALPSYDAAAYEKEKDSEDHIIVTGADAAAHLLPLRDDHEPALTFRSIFLATILSAFQAVVYQIYQVTLRSLLYTLRESTSEISNGLGDGYEIVRSDSKYHTRVATYGGCISISMLIAVVYDNLPYPTMLTHAPVQTDLDHNPGNVHRPHGLLPR
jgi:hypothetical protein